MNIAAYFRPDLAHTLHGYLRSELGGDLAARPGVSPGANGSKLHPHRPPIPEE